MVSTRPGADYVAPGKKTFRKKSLYIAHYTVVWSICVMFLRPLDGIEISASALNMFMTKPIQEWNDHLRGISMPDYYNVFGALVANAITLLFPDLIVDAIVPTLMDVFDLSASRKKFIWEEYVPAVIIYNVYVYNCHCFEFDLSASEGSGWYQHWIHQQVPPLGQRYIYGYKTALCFCVAGADF
jgi:hypothetical protein